MTDRTIDPQKRAEMLRAEAGRVGGAGGAATEENVALSTAITISLFNDDGYIGLRWNNDGSIGRWDYVALYDSPPASALGYLTNQWEWVESQSGTYQTGTKALGNSYWIAYCSWNYATGAYVIVQTAGPFQP